MDRKRSGEGDINNKQPQRPKFAGPGQNVFDLTENFVHRDNSACLAELSMHNQALFLRPTQMGKTNLLQLADMVYDKKNSQSLHVALPHDARSMFVLTLDFLYVDSVEDVDQGVRDCVKASVQGFLAYNPELKEHYKEPQTGAGAGAYLLAVAEAVSTYGISQDEGQSLLVLVDEYDKPVRDLLLGFIGEGEEARWETAKETLKNYRGFFSACKGISGGHFRKIFPGLLAGKVWVAGVLPIALKLISDFNPALLTFSLAFDDAIGLLDGDVDRMLEEVDGFFAFQNAQEKKKVRVAIGKLVNRLYFGSDTPLYHTRVVNSIMNILLVKKSRDQWLQNLSKLPLGVHFQEIPPTVYDVIEKQTGLRGLARDLSLNKEIFSDLKQSLDLGDVLRNPMVPADYLTLLVHLGIASVRSRDGQMVFQATSTLFRVPFFERLLRNSLQPLFDAETLDDLYKIGATHIEEFMQTLPKSGLASLVRWSKEKRSNNILELQFQGFLIGALVESLWSEDVETTQEDVLESGRTDVRISGQGTLLLLELKQKTTATAPTPKQMEDHQEQLHQYMEELVENENALTNFRRVAGFVVVMYNKGQSFHVAPYKHA